LYWPEQTMKAQFARNRIKEAAELILEDNPNVAVCSVIQSHFLESFQNEHVRRPADNKWYQLLVSTQKKNGNWTRFHRNLKNLPLREAVNKAIGIGLTKQSPILANARSFAIDGLLSPFAVLPDYLLELDDPCRAWASPALCLATLTNVACRLDVSDDITQRPIQELTRLARAAYPNGDYNIEAEHDYIDSKGLIVAWRAPQKEWQAAREKVVVEILGMHQQRLPKTFLDIYFKDLWHNFRYYDNYPPASEGVPERDPNAAAAWFMIHNILSLFPGWRYIASPEIDFLWKSQQNDGMWDFGLPADTSGFISRLQISSKWAGHSRRHDWSLYTLSLLARYYGWQQDWPTFEWRRTS